jgi:signal transduction histidine kinase
MEMTPTTNADTRRTARRGLAIYFAIVVFFTAPIQALIIYLDLDGGAHGMVAWLVLLTGLMFVPTIASVAARLLLKEGFADVSFRFGGRRGRTAIMLALVFPLLIRHKEGFETAAAAGDPVDDTLRLPLVYGGETVGGLILGLRAGEESFSPEENQLFEDLAHQVGVAAHATLLSNEAVALSADLQRSRERLVSAREEERCRLRRDLHDGLGPQLASLTMMAEAARDLIATDPPAPKSCSAA